MFHWLLSYPDFRIRQYDCRSGMWQICALFFIIGKVQDEQSGVHRRAQMEADRDEEGGGTFLIHSHQSSCASVHYKKLNRGKKQVVLLWSTFLQFWLAPALFVVCAERISERQRKKRLGYGVALLIPCHCHFIAPMLLCIWYRITKNRNALFWAAPAVIS